MHSRTTLRLSAVALAFTASIASVTTSSAREFHHRSHARWASTHAFHIHHGKTRNVAIRQHSSAAAVADAGSTIGMASFYGPGHAGRRAADGSIFNPAQMTAAHRSLPFGTRVQVTNLNNGKSVVVKISDRGPFIRGRIIDVSTGAARALDFVGQGVARVKLTRLAMR